MADTLASLARRIEALEARRRDESLPSILIVEDPNAAVLKDEVAAALEKAGRGCLILPIGRSALPDSDGGADPRIEAHRKFFKDT